MAEIVNMPRLGLNEDESMIGEWFVSEGDSVKTGDGLFSIETDKSSMTVFAETDGVVLKRFYNDFDVVRVMTPVCVLGQPGEDVGGVTPFNDGDEAAPPEAPAAEDTAVKPVAKPLEAPAPTAPEGPFFSPRAKKLALANGVEMADITATGAENRIIEADVIRAMQSAPATALPIAPPQAEATAQSAAEGARVVKMSNIRKVIARNMSASLQNTAQLTSHAKFNASALQKYREWYKAAPGGEKNITITDMILYAVAKTLKDFDYMNAHMVSDDELLYFDDINLGCAVDTEKGLMVPTVKSAQSLSLSELSQALKQLVEKCRDGSITPDEMSGATFTVSNLGAFGVTDFTPILNPPQVGILGVGTIDYAVKQTPEGILYYPAGHLSLTYDHRAVDGAPSARFLKALCAKLENFGDLV